jgi:hypothetical protein
VGNGEGSLADIGVDNPSCVWREIIRALDGAIDEIHWRQANETGNEPSGRCPVNLAGGAHLFDPSAVHQQRYLALSSGKGGYINLRRPSAT